MRLVWAACLCGSLLASAAVAATLQPVEDGLAPLLQQAQVVQERIRAVQQALQQTSLSADEQADHRQRLDALEREQTRLNAEIAQARSQQGNPLVLYVVQ